MPRLRWIAPVERAAGACTVASCEQAPAATLSLLGSHSPARRYADLKARDDMKTDQPAPRCPDCGKQMLFQRSLPKLGGLPELQTFKCENCGAVVTQEVAAELLELATL